MKFKNCASQKKIPLDNDTRWRSLHNMLSVAVEYHQEMTMFADFYKDMNKNKITNREFEKVKFVAKFLQTFANFSEFFESIKL